MTLAIDQDAPVSSLVPNSPSSSDSNVVGSEGDERLRRTLQEFRASDGQAEETSDAESFVDIMCSLEKEIGGAWEGFTFADIQQRAYLLSEFLPEGVVDAPGLPLC